MKVIIMDSEVYKSLIGKLTTIEHYIKQKEIEAKIGHISWIDNETVCKMLQISRRTLQRYRSNGLLPYTIVGKKVYYPLKDVEQFIRKKGNHKNVDPEKGDITSNPTNS